MPSSGTYKGPSRQILHGACVQYRRLILHQIATLSTNVRHPPSNAIALSLLLWALSDHSPNRHCSISAGSPGRFKNRPCIPHLPTKTLSWLVGDAAHFVTPLSTASHPIHQPTGILATQQTKQGNISVKSSWCNGRNYQRWRPPGNTSVKFVAFFLT